jgi:branched-chain amino acid transport system permease protein
MGLLWLFYHRTTIGLSMLAASIDEEGAATIGVHVPRMRTLTFLLGGAVGGLAGVLVSPLITIHYEMGLMLTLKGFAAAILGGLINPFGAVVGGLTLGLAESLAVLTVSSGYKDVIAMTILIVIMIVLPNGMLGRRGRRGG